MFKIDDGDLIIREKFGTVDALTGKGGRREKSQGGEREESCEGTAGKRRRWCGGVVRRS